MPNRSTGTVLGLAVLSLLTTIGCSHSSPARPEAKAPSATAHSSAQQDAASAAPLSSSTLKQRLLDIRDLGQGYALKPEASSRHDDVSVVGCPALKKLRGQAAVGGALNSPHHAKETFTYSGGTGSEVTEELYSDTATKLSTGTERVFDAMDSCPSYQVTAGSTPIQVTTQKAPVARLGDQRWGQLLTFTTGGRSSMIKQAGVRTGTTLTVVFGAPGLVDAHLNEAVDKAGTSS